MRFSQTKQFKAICFALIFSFITNSLTQAAPLNLPNPQEFIPLSSAYSFPALKGLKFDPANPLQMEFIVDTGDKKDISQEEVGLLIKYFLAGLTTPEQDIWVNLSPYEQERIIPESLSQTDLGKDLLSQDYLLKQLMASLTYPESDTGKDYWDKTYTEVMKIAQTTKLPVNTFNKVWIMPDEAEVYESDNAGLITKATLKVMLEEDYLAFKNREQRTENRGQKTEKGKEDERDAQINKAASQVMKEVILPEINSEVNSGKNFATLRQIYHSLILGIWFKQKFKQSIYKHYIDQQKIKGIDLEDKTVTEKIYQQYVQAFKTGLYNYIRTDQEPATNKRIKRRYYSGGFVLAGTGASPLKVRRESDVLLTNVVSPQSLKLTLRVSAFLKEEKAASSITTSQRELNLSQPLKVAFNIDSFPEDKDVLLFSGINRIFDSIFRLLEGNPNFTPTAIFLGDYVQGIRGSFERLSEYLRSNPALGNAKYKVKLDGDLLLINDQPIALYHGFATTEQLKELGIDYLIDAPRQRYLNITNRSNDKQTVKRREEKKQFLRIKQYLDKLPNLKIAVIPSEEDKGAVFNAAAAGLPLVNRVNTATEDLKRARLFVLAEPVTTVAATLGKIVQDLVKTQNAKTKVEVAVIAVTRSDRQGNRLIDARNNIRSGRGVNKILGGKESPDFEHSRVIDGAVLKSANMLELELVVKGFVDISADAINTAVEEAAEGQLKGLIEIKKDSETGSYIENLNPHLLVFHPLRSEDVKKVLQENGPPYKILKLKAYYSELGYAKQILDFITEHAISNGNPVSAQEKEEYRLGDKVVPNTIPATPQIIKLQIVEDGQPLEVQLNAATGRISVGWLRQNWDNPNIKLVGINGVKPALEDISGYIIEHDVVSGDAPFTITVSPDKKAFIFKDREERIIAVKEDTGIINTPYGHLVITREADKIKAIKLHGEEAKIEVRDSQDGISLITARLDNGTGIRLYLKDNVIISVGLRKQVSVPVTNVRPEKDVYNFDKKKETQETYLNRVAEYNRQLSRRIIVEMPWLNARTIILEGSGALLEKIKLEPFHLAGTGGSIMPAPAKVESKIPGLKPADATIIPGANTEVFLSTWGMLETLSCASCTSNAGALSMKALLSIVAVTAGFFDTVHAITRTQGAQFGEIMKNITRSLDARGTMVWEETGASTEVGKVIAELLNIVSGVSLRVGNDVGSLVYFDLQVVPREGQSLPTVEKINAKIKQLTEMPEKDGGLKGFLGYGVYNTSLEIIGTPFGGIFDPSKTMVNPDTGTVSFGTWYANEGGFLGNLGNLLLLQGLYGRELEKKIAVVAQNVVAEAGPYTGRINVKGARDNGADSLIVGLSSFRIMEEEANRTRTASVAVNQEINQALKEAFKQGVKLPILNIYISELDWGQGRVLDAINRQISQALRNIPPEDIIRMAISLEAAGPHKTEEIEKIVRDIRATVSGYVSRSSFGVEMGKDAAEILGANVARKVRVLFNLQSGDMGIVDTVVNIAGVDGMIIPQESGIINRDYPDFFAGTSKKVAELIGKNPVKQRELRKRIDPRFLMLGSFGSSLVDLSAHIKALEDGPVNSYFVQIAFAPALPQISELASVLKNEPVAGKLSRSPHKLPVRILIQNVVLEANKDGFVNLEDAIDKFGGTFDILLNHSELRALTGITSAEIAQILKEAHRLKREGTKKGNKLKGNIFLAIGDQGSDFSSDQSMDIIEKQLFNSLAGLSVEEVADTLIVYEPVWSISKGIGTNVAAPQEIIQGRHAAIRFLIERKWGSGVAKEIRIVYGGSVAPDTAEGILGLPDVDGALVGARSSQGNDFIKIVSIASNLAPQKEIKRGFVRPMWIAGNTKTYNVDYTYPDIVNRIAELKIDRRKVEVALAPKMSEVPNLIEVYTQDPLKNIVWFDQLNRQDIKGKLVFQRVDYNFPINIIDENSRDFDVNNSATWHIADETRLDGSLTDIVYAIKNGAITALYTHFEPKLAAFNNLKDPPSIEFMVPILRKRLSQALGRDIKITFVRDILGTERQSALKKARPGDVILFENLRHDPKIRELEKTEKNTPEDIAKRNAFAAKLYAGSSEQNPAANVIVVLNAFGVFHRNQTSVSFKLKDVPVIGGTLARKESLFLNRAITEGGRPIAFMLGGGPKVKDKVPQLVSILRNILDGERGDKLFFYGGAALAFYKAQNPDFQLGLSRNAFDAETIAAVKEVVRVAQEEGVEIILPDDAETAERLPVDARETIYPSAVSIEDIPPTEAAFDIGPKTGARTAKELYDNNGNPKFATIIWSGPAGVSEYSPFTKGTNSLAELLARVSQNENNPQGSRTLILGADTVTAVKRSGNSEGINYYSTGGGASLEYLAGNNLPGLKSLNGAAGELRYHLNPQIEEKFKEIRAKVSDYAEVIARHYELTHSAASALAQSDKSLDTSEKAAPGGIDFGGVVQKTKVSSSSVAANNPIVNSPAVIPLDFQNLSGLGFRIEKIEYIQDLKQDLEGLFTAYNNAGPMSLDNLSGR